MEIMRFETNNIAKLVRQRLCWSLFLVMLQSSSSQGFTFEFFEILQIRILQNTSRRLLLEHFWNASASIFMSFIRLEGFRKVQNLKDFKCLDFPVHLEQNLYRIQSYTKTMQHLDITVSKLPRRHMT